MPDRQRLGHRRRVARGGFHPVRSLRIWGLRHAQAALASLGRLARAPAPSLLTIAVIGIALALPAALHLLVRNAAHFGQGWEGATQVSLFLERNVTDDAARTLAKALAHRSDVASAHAISRKQALAEFRRHSGFSQALEVLKRNPLPAVIVIRPTSDSAAAVEHLVKQLQAIPEIDRVQMDRQWLQRYFAIVHLVQRGVTMLSVLLGIAVVIVVGNTIRLDIQSRHQEIEVQKLIGATDAFIRRPFLYSGLWYGALGGIAACALLGIGLLALHGPASHLAVLYHAQSLMPGLDATTAGSVIAGGAVLAWGGSFLAVGRHLRRIEPA
ncbi:MAG TPA: permease-like cell division protein FtsX [Gammaproteobacteria bacterium]|nr:permease-like cell division protein FtsX [Gammaproteobacteria bacterium]